MEIPCQTESFSSSFCSPEFPFSIFLSGLRSFPRFVLNLMINGILKETVFNSSNSHFLGKAVSIRENT